MISCSKDEVVYQPTEKVSPYKLYSEAYKAFDKNDFFNASKKFTEAEMKKLGVDKIKLLDQRVCPIYPERYINPNSKTVEYKGKVIYLWSSSAQRRWKRDPDAYFKEAFDKGLLPQFKS